ncbi:hypothetical protein H920_20092 [Fukomys damarensis]|uniref:Uncharacterized protein n=1 Tax=Fukomys damarensis TaxID=885580 RepID=A0A091CM80_FUKDA|nr:hypothetical protein H920_20092 [Fukomys damarensis]
MSKQERDMKCRHVALKQALIALEKWPVDQPVLAREKTFNARYRNIQGLPRLAYSGRLHSGVEECRRLCPGDLKDLVRGLELTMESHYEPIAGGQVCAGSRETTSEVKAKTGVPLRKQERPRLFVSLRTALETVLPRVGLPHRAAVPSRCSWAFLTQDDPVR